MEDNEEEDEEDEEERKEMIEEEEGIGEGAENEEKEEEEGLSDKVLEDEEASGSEEVRDRPVIGRGEGEGNTATSSLSSVSCCSIDIFRSLSFFCLIMSSLSLVALHLGTQCCSAVRE